MHVDGHSEAGVGFFVVRHQGQRRDGVDENGAEAAVEGPVVVAVLRLNLQADDDAARAPADKLTLKKAVLVGELSFSLNPNLLKTYSSLKEEVLTKSQAAQLSIFFIENQ